MADNKNLFIRITGEQLQQIFKEIRDDVSKATPGLFSEYILSEDFDQFISSKIDEKVSRLEEATNTMLTKIPDEVKDRVDALFKQYTDGLEDTILQIVNDKFDELFGSWDEEGEEEEEELVDGEDDNLIGGEQPEDKG